MGRQIEATTVAEVSFPQAALALDHHAALILTGSEAEGARPNPVLLRTGCGNEPGSLCQFVDVAVGDVDRDDGGSASVSPSSRWRTPGSSGRSPAP